MKFRKNATHEFCVTNARLSLKRKRKNRGMENRGMGMGMGMGNAERGIFKTENL